MNLAQHLEKVARYEALMERLDVLRDFELWVWVAMSSGTNVLNAALHATGITSDRACYPVRPNRYMVPGASPATWTQEEGPLGDVLHVGRTGPSRPPCWRRWSAPARRCA